MPNENDRRPQVGFFVVLGALFVFAAALPAACHHGEDLAPADGGTKGGASGGMTGDAAGTGGGGTGGTDGPALDQASDSARQDSASGDAGGGGTAAGGRGGNTSGAAGGSSGGGAAGDRVIDGGAGAGGMGGEPSDGGVTDGSAPDAMFPCGPCGTLWICGGIADANQTNLTLMKEDDGCYISGLPGHKLLAPDGKITEGGANIATAKALGPQVGVYNPDGSQWFYCGVAQACDAQ